MATRKERKSFIIILGFLGILLCISSARAQQPQAKQPATPVLDQRIGHQSKLIDEKFRAGHFTQDERKTLIDNVNYVRDQESQFKATGKITEAEKAQLERVLDENSHMINKERPVKALRPGGVGSKGLAAAGKEAPAKAVTTGAPGKPVSETLPAKEMKAEKAATSMLAGKLSAGKKININAASKEELGALPGI